MASVMPSKNVTMARGIRVEADVLIEDVKAEDFDLVRRAPPCAMPGTLLVQGWPVLGAVHADVCPTASGAVIRLL